LHVADCRFARSDALVDGRALWRAHSQRGELKRSEHAGAE
jgi:hypothetical protein